MDIIERIKDNFSKGYYNRAMVIPELPVECPGWTFKHTSWIAVAIPITEYKPFAEHFSNVKISTERDVLIDGKSYDILMLMCSDVLLRNEFATICGQFVEPGINGSGRANLIENPEKWWKQWRSLLGNAISNNEPYSELGELIMLEFLLKSGKNPVWSGAQKATHDIEMETSSVEVKSTTARYGYEVTISSLYQMVPPEEKKLDLAFFRFEKSLAGRSLDDVVANLIQLGYSEVELEKALTSKGLEKGCTARNIRYKIIETKRYSVDESFPAVTECSFKGDRMPEKVVRFTYTVDLSGLTGTPIF